MNGTNRRRGKKNGHSKSLLHGGTDGGSFAG